MKGLLDAVVNLGNLAIIGMLAYFAGVPNQFNWFTAHLLLTPIAFLFCMRIGLNVLLAPGNRSISSAKSVHAW